MQSLYFPLFDPKFLLDDQGVFGTSCGETHYYLDDTTTYQHGKPQYCYK